MSNINAQNIIVTNLTVTNINGRPASAPAYGSSCYDPCGQTDDCYDCSQENNDCPECFELPPLPPAGAQGATGATGAAATGIYGSYYSLYTLYNTGATASGPIRYMLFENVETQNGISITNPTDVIPGNTGLGYTGATGSILNIGHTGVYNIQFSAQVNKVSGTHNLYIWSEKGFTSIPYSNTQISLSGSNNKTVAAWNFMYKFNANDNYRLAWSSDDDKLTIQSSGPVGATGAPGIPSVILTANKV